MADPTQIVFGPSGIADSGRCRVYTRERWADEWEEEPYLFAEELTWCCAPAMPTASFRWDYGRILHHDSSEWETVEKLDWSFPRYVKIVVECEYDDENEVWLTRTWYGRLELAIDQTDGAAIDDSGDEPVALPTGRQTFTAFGMEGILAQERPRYTAFADGNGEQSCDGLRMTFNYRGTKNRSPTEELLGDCYIFYYAPQISEYWSTKEIVRYLLKHATPRDSDDLREIRFQVRSGCYLPDWDNPEVPLEGNTTLGLLQQLLHRGRLLNWWFEVIDDVDGDIVELVTQTITKQDLPTNLPGGHTIPETTRKLHLIYDTDQETRAVAKDSGLPVCDQVVVRGGLVKYIGTFSDWSRIGGSGQFHYGWSQADEDAYNEGASSAVDYANLDLVSAQRRNAVVRSSSVLERVFSRFNLSVAWTGRSTNYEFYAPTDLFVRYDGEAVMPTPYSAIEIAPYLPLYYGFDYAGVTGDAVGEIARGNDEEPQNEREYMAPLLLFAIRDDNAAIESYVIGSEMGRAADTEQVDDEDQPACTVGIYVVPHSRTIDMRVTGKPQHVIAGLLFSPLEEDEDVAAYDFTDCIATLCLTNGTHIEERYPADRKDGVDTLRVMEIEVGDEYEAVYIAPGTVVGLSDTALPTTSSGGWIERPHGMRDQLAALALIAYSWYSEPHFVLNLETTRLKSDTDIKLGDLVSRVGDDEDANNTHQRDILAPITEIRVSWPTTDDGDQPQAPTMSLTTTAGELDPIQLSAPPNQAKDDKVRKPTKQQVKKR